MSAPSAATPIIVVSPQSEEAQTIAGWLRGAGLGAISTVRTCDEAIFMLGRGHPGLLIIDEQISSRAERRLLQHVRASGPSDGFPLVRLVGATAGDPLAAGRAMAAEVIRKPLQAHDVVVRVGAAMQLPDLLGRLDQSLDQAAQHLEAAGQMQIGLLPTADELRMIQRQCGVGVAALYRSGEEVGGDFWGIWPTGKGRLAVTLVDFAGHGLSAALNTFRLHALLSEHTLPRGMPTRMTALLNHRLQVLLPRGQYATMVYLQIDPGRRRIAWCGAGGPPPLLVSVDGTFDLDGRGMPLGIRRNTVYRRRWMKLPASGVLAMFSDGLLESGGRDPDVPRAALAHALARPAGLAARGALVQAAQEGAASLEALRDLYPSSGHSDDVMAICLAFGPAPN
jgi:sigma-B regulation protein RsbU (phosphoserine phosphatase)